MRFSSVGHCRPTALVTYGLDAASFRSGSWKKTHLGCTEEEEEEGIFVCYCSTDNGYSPKCPDLPFFLVANAR